MLGRHNPIRASKRLVSLSRWERAGMLAYIASTHPQVFDETLRSIGTHGGAEAMSQGRVEIGYLCYHGHYCFYADPEEAGQCGSKRVGTITLAFDDTDAPEDWTVMVADAQSSLAEKYETWRTCECRP